MATTGHVKGLREFMRALALADKETRKQVRARLRTVGDAVRADAAARFAVIDAGSASTFRVSVRQRGIAVEQARRKVTGMRPDFGALQMRIGLIPAADDKEGDLERELEQALDDIADIVEGR